jgi:glycosyltransferase involved in cell wall biosynthesis
MMPCHNNASYIEEAVSSVLNQQVDCSFEVVIVDDASTDDSVDRIQALNDARIRLIRNAENRGIAAVRNQLLEEARGHYLTSLDGDDVYLGTAKLATELSLLRASSDSRPIIVYSDVESFDSKRQQTSLASRAMPPHEGIIFQGLLDRRIMIPRDFLIPAELARGVGGFDTSLPIYEDWDYKLRLAQKASFRFTGRVGIGYRRHGRGLSAVSGRTHRQYISRIRQKYGIQAFDGDPIQLMKSLRRADRVSMMFAKSKAA